MIQPLFVGNIVSLLAGARIPHLESGQRHDDPLTLTIKSSRSGDRENHSRLSRSPANTLYQLLVGMPANHSRKQYGRLGVRMVNERMR